ncbi:MAG: SMP-30/gluconolactonase/LRE family protein, partial [Desulfobacteraceae bacterium]
MKKYIMILVVVAAIPGYFLFWPARIEPISYEPAKKPEMTGALAPNNEL